MKTRAENAPDQLLLLATDDWVVVHLVLCCRDKKPGNLQRTSQWTEELSESDPVLQHLNQKRENNFSQMKTSTANQQLQTKTSTANQKSL